jgi:RNA ligase
MNHKHSIFPYITCFTNFSGKVAHKPELRFLQQSNNAIVGCYMISDKDTFSDEYAREMRGIVFCSKTDSILSRSMHKFFNVGERPETAVDVIDWANIVRVMDKRDGSMIQTVDIKASGIRPLIHEGCFAFKSKKSFESDVVKQANAWVLADEARRNRYVSFCNVVTAYGGTVTFEWTSPTARIVLGYTEPMLTLLHVRMNNTGLYLPIDTLQSLADEFSIPIVETPTDIDLSKISLEYLQERVATVEGKEGWVFQHASGEMYKLKTKWYMDRHRAMTFLRVRDIARLAINEELDDLKAQLVGDGIDISQIEEIESRVVKLVTDLETSVLESYEQHKHLDRKSYAIKMKELNHKYFSLVMRAYIENGNVDVREYFEKMMLDDMFDLTQLNLTNSVAEID